MCAGRRHGSITHVRTKRKKASAGINRRSQSCNRSPIPASSAEASSLPAYLATGAARAGAMAAAGPLHCSHRSQPRRGGRLWAPGSSSSNAPPPASIHAQQHATAHRGVRMPARNEADLVGKFAELLLFSAWQGSAHAGGHRTRASDYASRATGIWRIRNPRFMRRLHLLERYASAWRAEPAARLPTQLAWPYDRMLGKTERVGRRRPRPPASDARRGGAAAAA